MDGSTEFLFFLIVQGKSRTIKLFELQFEVKVGFRTTFRLIMEKQLSFTYISHRPVGWGGSRGSNEPPKNLQKNKNKKK